MNSIDNAQTILQAGINNGTPKSITGFKPVILVPEGCTAHTMERQEFPPLPDHVRQTINFIDHASFSRYVKTFKNPNSIIVAEPPIDGGNASFRAIIDYHVPPSGASDPTPRRAMHVANLNLIFSSQFLIWRSASGKQATQEQFLDFIEENATDLVTPSLAELMEVAMKFQSTTKISFASKVNRVTGGRELTYNETTEAGVAASQKKQVVPVDLSIVIPIFEGGLPASLRGRIVWRPADGQLTIGVKLLNIQEQIRFAVEQIRGAIRSETGIDPYSGSVTPPQNTVG